MWWRRAGGRRPRRQVAVRRVVVRRLREVELRSHHSMHVQNRALWGCAWRIVYHPVDCARSIKGKKLLSYIKFELGGRAWMRQREEGLGATAAATGAGASQRGVHRIARMCRIEPSLEGCKWRILYHPLGCILTIKAKVLLKHTSHSMHVQKWAL